MGNVVRWKCERLFLRTAEFLWQEGHTAHETKNEAMEEAQQMNQVYADFVEIFGNSSYPRAEIRFRTVCGAEETFCIEALMQDGKALQAGTSHFWTEFCQGV